MTADFSEIRQYFYLQHLSEHVGCFVYFQYKDYIVCLFCYLKVIRNIFFNVGVDFNVEIVLSVLTKCVILKKILGRNILYTIGMTFKLDAQVQHIIFTCFEQRI